MLLAGLDEKSGRFVEGISNSALAAVLTLFLGALSIIYLLWKHRPQHIAVIHPDHLPLVQQVRRQLQGILGGGGGDDADDDAETTTATEQNGARVEPSAPPLPPPPTYNQERVCPVCFATARFAVRTNCGHLFCCSCIATYWRLTRSIVRPIDCPVCRQEVSVLLPSFAEADPAEPGRAEANGDVNDYNRRFSGAPRPVWDHIRDLPVLVPYLVGQLFSLQGLLMVFRVRLFLCIAGIVVYVLSPFDIIPEAVFGVFGILDDLFVAFILLAYATVILRRILAERQD